MLLARLNLPERLWALPPATFSGGEQQRVNIARGFITDHPVLLLDEPTASLDATNRAVVVEMIAEKKRAGVALLGIFHDEEVRAAGRRPDRRCHRLCPEDCRMKLSETPFVHPTAHVSNSTLGRYTEIGAGCHVAHSTVGDYSYCVENTQIAYTTIGKFANIASHVRIYASMHPHGAGFAAPFHLSLELVF